MTKRADASGMAFWRDADDTEARERYQTLVHAIDDGIFHLGAERRFVAVNDFIVEMTGYAREELLGEHVSVLFDEDDVSAIEHEIERLRADPTERSESLELTVETASRKRVLWELQVNPIIEEDTLQGTVGIAREVTERKRRERERQRVVQALEAGREGVSLLDEDGEFVYVNDVYADTFGYDPEEMIGERWDTFDIDADPDRFYDEILPRIADEGQWSGTTTCLRSDDSTFLAHHSLAPTEDDELTCVVRDVTDQWERERERERYETAIQNMRDGVYMTDADRRYTMVNDAYLDMIGMEREEVIGEPVSTVVGEEATERSAEVLEEMLAGEREVGQAEGHHHGVTDRYVENWYTLLLLDDGEFAGTTGVVRDITERKEYERKLEQSNDRLEQFAYAISHDMQEPLRMVSSYLQLIEDRYGDALDENGEEFLAFAVDGADRMREMIQGLLEYSRVETQGDPFEVVDLDAVLEGVLEALRLQIEDNGAEITAEELPAVRGDANQLRQVFQNLLSNAIEYSGDEPPQVHVSAERDGPEWLIAVRDEGIGIDPDDADRIFEVFQSLRTDDEPAGTGIGLALCERIVERHEGEIWVESTRGEGSTFFVSLPDARV